VGALERNGIAVVAFNGVIPSAAASRDGGLKFYTKRRQIPPQRPTPWLGISDSNFDVQGEYSSL
jgi:hypothetical protein